MTDPERLLAEHQDFTIVITKPDLKAQGVRIVFASPPSASILVNRERPFTVRQPG
jgi:hypothetical protein